jgi:hypothetical protein
MMIMDASSATLFTFGLASLLMSWVLLLITSWKEDFTWGLFTLLLPPVSYLYALSQPSKAGAPIVFAIAGWCLILFS